MHNALDRRVRIVADRIAIFFRRGDQFPRVGHELPCDRIIRVGRVDQSGEGGRDGDGIVCGHLFQPSYSIASDKLGLGKS